MNGRAAAFAAGAGLVLLAGLVGAAVALGARDEGDDRLWQLAGSALAGAVAGGAFLAGLRLLDLDRRSPYGWPAVAVAPAALVALLLPLWDAVEWSERVVKVELSALATLISVLVVAAGRLAAPVLRVNLPLVAIVALALALTLGGIWWSEPADVEDRDVVFRWLTALWVAAVALFVAIPLGVRALAALGR